MQEYQTILKNNNFLYVWFSQILSQLTVNMMNFILLIKLFDRTGSAMATSFLWVSYALPALMIGPVAATVVDMVDKRKILMITNLLQAATIFLYALSHRTSFFLVYGIVFAYSLFNQFYVPAEAATLPAVLPKKDLAHGNSLFFLTQQAAIILGFGVAGFLNKILGFGHTLYLCSFFVLLAFISVSFLPKIKQGSYSRQKIENALAIFFNKLIEGYKFIKNNRRILAPFLTLTSIQIVLAIVTVLIPVIAVEVLGIDLDLAGIYVIAPAAVGAIIGVFVVPKLLKEDWRKKKIIEFCLALSGIIFLFMAFSWLGFFGFTRTIVGSLCILFMGFCFVGISIPSQTYFQEVTPGGMRGRVFGNFWFFVTVVTVLPTIFSGAISELFGVKFLFIVLGIGSLLFFVYSKKYGNSFLNNNHE